MGKHYDDITCYFQWPKTWKHLLCVVLKPKTKLQTKFPIWQWCVKRGLRRGFEGGLFRLTLASMIQGWVKPCVKSSIIACRDQDQCNCQESQIEADRNESLGNSKPPYKTIRIAAAENRRLKDIDWGSIRSIDVDGAIKVWEECLHCWRHSCIRPNLVIE